MLFYLLKNKTIIIFGFAWTVYGVWCLLYLNGIFGRINIHLIALRYSIKVISLFMKRSYKLRLILWCVRNDYVILDKNLRNWYISVCAVWTESFLGKLRSFERPPFFENARLWRPPEYFYLSLETRWYRRWALSRCTDESPLTQLCQRISGNFRRTQVTIVPLPTLLGHKSRCTGSTCSIRSPDSHWSDRTKTRRVYITYNNEQKYNNNNNINNKCSI